MNFTSRQIELLVGCIDAELENSEQCDTALSLNELDRYGIEASDDDDLISDTIKNLRTELRALKAMLVNQQPDSDTPQ